MSSETITATKVGKQPAIITCPVCHRKFQERAKHSPYCSRKCLGISRRTPFDQRFWSHVLKTGTCWIWQGVQRYGSAYRCGKPIQAHRASFEMAYGPIPHGLQVLHKCDNPACVRPDHLFLGTQSDNIRDSITKGRFAMIGDTHWSRLKPWMVTRGDRNGNRKLSENKVREIRKLHYKGATYLEIGEQFGVHSYTIGRIIRCESWKHVTV